MLCNGDFTHGQVCVAKLSLDLGMSRTILVEQQISYVAIPSDNHNYDCFLNNSISALILCVKWSILNCKGKSENNRKKCAGETICNIQNQNNHTNPKSREYNVITNLT